MRKIMICGQGSGRDNLTVALVKALFPECDVTLLDRSDTLFSPPQARRVDLRPGGKPSNRCEGG